MRKNGWALGCQGEQSVASFLIYRLGTYSILVSLSNTFQPLDSFVLVVALDMAFVWESEDVGCWCVCKYSNLYPLEWLISPVLNLTSIATQGLFLLSYRN